MQPGSYENCKSAYTCIENTQEPHHIHFEQLFSDRNTILFLLHTDNEAKLNTTMLLQMLMLMGEL